MISKEESKEWNFSKQWSKMGLPWISKNCLGKSVPMRFPIPPAVMMTDPFITLQKYALPRN
jgi:hypothetical protein